MLLFSERKTLEKFYNEWITENNIANTPFNVITFLVIKDLIKIEEAEDYINENENEICIGRRSGKTYNKIQEMAKEIVKLQREVEFQKGQRKFWRDEYYQKMERIQEIVEKSYNDIDYFNRDIRKDLENLLKE